MVAEAKRASPVSEPQTSVSRRCDVATSCYNVAMSVAPQRRHVGVRELKNETSAVLRRVRGGEVVVVTARAKPVALLMPVGDADDEELLRALLLTGRFSWAGGKPRGLARRACIRGTTVAAAVVEDRR